MIKKISFFVFAAMAVCSVNVFAQADGKKLDDVLAKMEAVDKKINTAEITYTQEIFYSATKEKQVITGNLKYKKPDNIFIVQKTPQEQMVYIDGKKITIYTPENSQAVVDSWKDVVNGDFTPTSMVNFSSNWKSIQKDNTITYVGEDDQNYIISVAPAKKNEWNMQLHVDKTTMLPKKAIVTAAGLIVNVDISDYKVNQSFKKDIFKFTAPAGVEVIELN